MKKMRANVLHTTSIGFMNTSSQVEILRFALKDVKNSFQNWQMHHLSG